MPLRHNTLLVDVLTYDKRAIVETLVEARCEDNIEWKAR